MGHLHQDVGRIGLESRGDTFTIHAGYGYRMGRKKIGSLKPGNEFRQLGDSCICKVYALFEERVECVVLGGGEEAGAHIELQPDNVVEVPGTEEQEPAHPLGRWWRDNEHPPFMMEDLPDLIEALQALQKEAR